MSERGLEWREGGGRRKEGEGKKIGVIKQCTCRLYRFKQQSLTLHIGTPFDIVAAERLLHPHY